MDSAEMPWYNHGTVTIPSPLTRWTRMLTAPSRDWSVSADLCRSLGGVSARPSALSDPLLRWSGGADARVWQSGKDRGPRVSLSALRPGQASGGHELYIVLVLTVCQGLCRHLGQPGEPGSPRGRDVSAYHPDDPSDVPHDFLPACRCHVERVYPLRGAM